MSFMSEFREVRRQGSVVDLAVGVIIGGRSARSSIRWSRTSSCRSWQDFRRPRFFELVRHARQSAAELQRSMSYEALTKAGVPLFATAISSRCDQFIIPGVHHTF